MIKQTSTRIGGRMFYGRSVGAAKGFQPRRAKARICKAGMTSKFKSPSITLSRGKYRLLFGQDCLFADTVMPKEAVLCRYLSEKCAPVRAAANETHNAEF
ncbi:MAG: hypothetical protein A3H32_07250 [Betaproteobacteria bacterium RIFCSPLOWO2_02_FULL_63_19]|nr:MAG: hypothetical protein A3H32_07250 [Betaproteobacteria bacterium RIFCSPLOWO2_02_FULL_63_19]